MKLRKILFFLYFRSGGAWDWIQFFTLKASFFQFLKTVGPTRLSRCVLSKDPVFRVEICSQNGADLEV